MVRHIFNPSIWKAETCGICEFKTSLIYIVEILPQNKPHKTLGDVVEQFGFQGRSVSSLSITGLSDLAKGLAEQVTMVLSATASLLIILSAVVWGHTDTRTLLTARSLVTVATHPVLPEARSSDMPEPAAGLHRLAVSFWAGDSVNPNPAWKVGSVQVQWGSPQHWLGVESLNFWWLHCCNTAVKIHGAN